ncbi:MAG: ABC transporter permease subunit [Myxococcota bacterium]|nr:ABC transporter permease subunit [Myxococcota bacterium]
MSSRRSEILPTAVLAGCAALAVGLAVAVVAVVAGESIGFAFGDHHVSVDVWALCRGTLTVSFLALAVALPLGLTMAVTLRELASPALRLAIRPWLALFATMPPIVFAYLAITVQRGVRWSQIPALTLGLLLAPFVARVFDTALRNAPEGMRDAALALGATRLEAWLHILLPASARAMASAVLLTFVRAIGESVVVAVAASTEVTTLAAEPVRAALGRGPPLSHPDIFVVGGVLVAATVVLHRLAMRLYPRERT